MPSGPRRCPSRDDPRYRRRMLIPSPRQRQRGTAARVVQRPGAFRGVRRRMARERTLVCERLASGSRRAGSRGGERKLVGRRVRVRRRRAQRPVTRETQFRIGSVSKPLTATAVALLYEAGSSISTRGAALTCLRSEKGTHHHRQLAASRRHQHYKDREFLLNRRFATVLDGSRSFRTIRSFSTGYAILLLELRLDSSRRW